MSQIKSKNTKPEKVVRSLLHKLGYRFRIHCKNLPGYPDIVLPKYNLAIFVHGCYWHRHKKCKYAYNPKSKIDFWQNKFVQNKNRDKLNKIKLNKLGWYVEIIWECETKDPSLLNHRIKKIFFHLEDLSNEK